MKIHIIEKVCQRPNGDRATTTSPSSVFKVILINGEKNKTLFKNDQFDQFYTSINGKRESYLKEAQAEALEWANLLDCEVDIDPTEISEEAEIIKKEIKSLQKRLKQLE